MSPKEQNKDKNQMALSFNFEQNEIMPAEAAQLPTLLSHSPFFKPTTTRKKGDTLGFDDQDGESFRVGLIEWIRFGPGLDTFDLETLITVIQLINVKAKASRHDIEVIELALTDGNSRQSPKTFEEIDISEDVFISGEEIVHNRFGVVTPTAINRYIGRQLDSDSLEKTRNSVTRLARNTSKLINHGTGRIEENVPFYKLSSNKSGAFIIRFPPEMNFLLYKYMGFNLTMCRQFTDIGKAMMLWMNPLEGCQEISLDIARQKTQFDGPLKEFKRALVTGWPKKNVKPVLVQMVDLGFLRSAEITGTGRKVPFSLCFERLE